MTGTLDRIEAYWKRADNLPDIRRDVLALVEVAKAAQELSHFLENEKETREPPRELLDQGYVALESSADYEREEELGTALAAALARLEDNQ